ncbi:MAG: ATP-binding cassette domain-containing protein, partial [Eubacteriales bacterium]|nr:ATP-binding cassette domain-containing protein [Eubacteriales bacterium]
MIRVREMSFSYRDEAVLQNLSFDVNPGDFVAVIGENGTGKSTLIKLLLGQLSPDCGEISVLGLQPGRHQAQRQIAYVSQNGLNHHLRFPANAEEVVRCGLYQQMPRFKLWGKKEREAAAAALD